MTANPDSVGAEALRLHTGWMRRLARSLVRDDAQADDVVQDAVIAAMRSPPRDATALPAWLASTVRNGARRLWRGEGRRSAREAIAARPEAASSAVEVVARAEEHGLVVQAVLALDEPYRAAVLLRFFDDLPPREVARRTGVPVETARARIRRGLERLREKLDSVHGGDGREWRLALVPLMFPRAATVAGAGTGGGSATVAGSKLTTGAFLMLGSGAVAGVAGVALIAGAAVGWWFSSAKSKDAVETHLVTIAARETEIQRVNGLVHERDDQVKKLTAQVSDVEAKRRSAEKDLDTLRRELEAKKAELEKALAAHPESATATAAPAAKGARFAFDQYGKLADVDWNSVGEHMSAMPPLLLEITDAMEKGEALSPETAGNIQKHNGPLVTVAMKIMDQLPGTGANGSFTHPAFMVNAIAATLDAAGKSLSPEQASAIEKLAREFADEDARRLQAYPESTWALQKTIDECDLRRRFFESALGLLSEDQHATLSPPKVRGLMGPDLFSDGIIWTTITRPVAFKDEAGLTTAVAGIVNTALRLPQDKQDAARAVIARWVHDLPATVREPASDQIGGFGRPLGEVRDAARQTLVLVQRVSADLSLEGKPAEVARQWGMVIAPAFDKE